MEPSPNEVLEGKLLIRIVACILNGIMAENSKVLALSTLRYIHFSQF